MLHFEVHRKKNNAPWIIFIHGAGGSAAAWQRQWEFFKTDFNLLALDLRDHGQSKHIKPEKNTYTFDLIAEDILEVIENLDIQKAHFITLSFGSVLMQDLSMRKPELVDKVVMAGGIFRGNWAIKTFVHLARFFNLFLSYEQMYSTFSYLLMPKERHQISRRVYQIHARKITNQEYLKWLGLYSTFFSTLKRFYYQPIPFETQVIMGEDDYIFLKAAKDFTAIHEKVSLTLLPKAGHICNIDQADAFNQKVMAFLKPKIQAKKTAIF